MSLSRMYKIRNWSKYQGIGYKESKNGMYLYRVVLKKDEIGNLVSQKGHMIRPINAQEPNTLAHRLSHLFNQMPMMEMLSETVEYGLVILSELANENQHYFRPMSGSTMHLKIKAEDANERQEKFEHDVKVARSGKLYLALDDISAKKLSPFIFCAATSHSELTDLWILSTQDPKSIINNDCIDSRQAFVCYTTDDALRVMNNFDHYCENKKNKQWITSSAPHNISIDTINNPTICLQLKEIIDHLGMTLKELSHHLGSMLANLDVVHDKHMKDYAAYLEDDKEFNQSLQREVRRHVQFDAIGENLSKEDLEHRHQFWEKFLSEEYRKNKIEHVRHLNKDMIDIIDDITLEKTIVDTLIDHIENLFSHSLNHRLDLLVKDLKTYSILYDDNTIMSNIMQKLRKEIFHDLNVMAQLSESHRLENSEKITVTEEPLAHHDNIIVINNYFGENTCVGAQARIAKLFANDNQLIQHLWNLGNGGINGFKNILNTFLNELSSDKITRSIFTGYMKENADVSIVKQLLNNLDKLASQSMNDEKITIQRMMDDKKMLRWVEKIMKDKPDAMSNNLTLLLTFVHDKMKEEREVIVEKIYSL
jgi:hypothetical protein